MHMERAADQKARKFAGSSGSNTALQNTSASVAFKRMLAAAPKKEEYTEDHTVCAPQKEAGLGNPPSVNCFILGVR